jgi:hypothetical protein
MKPRSRPLEVRRLAWALLGVCVWASWSLAVDFPKRKPGLWEITRPMPNAKLPPQVQRVCLDAATDALLYRYGLGVSHDRCSKLDLRNVGGSLQVDAVCKLGGSQMSLHKVISYQGDTSYHEDTSVHYDPPLLGKTGDSKSTQDGKWLGACGADMKPGDLVTVPSPMNPVPLRLNLNDMLKEGS